MLPCQIISLLALGVVQTKAALTSLHSRSSLLNNNFNLGACLCAGGRLCLGDQPQCTVDNTESTICCVYGQKAVNGKCVDGSSNLCFDQKTVCSGDTPQCSIDNRNATVCCPVGQKALNGKCVDISSNLCSDGRTICSGDKPQCSNDVSIYLYGTGGTVIKTLCCANEEKSISGKCYPRRAKLMPCYSPGVCDFGEGYYCAWNAGSGYSTCCKFDEYLKGNKCVKK